MYQNAVVRVLPRQISEILFCDLGRSAPLAQFGLNCSIRSLLQDIGSSAYDIGPNQSLNLFRPMQILLNHSPVLFERCLRPCMKSHKYIVPEQVELSEWSAGCIQGFE